MEKYLKCLVSFFLGVVCIYLGMTMTPTKEQQPIIYFLYLVGIVNLYLAGRDLLAIFKNKE